MGDGRQQRLFGSADDDELPEWATDEAEDLLAAEIVFNLPAGESWTYLVPDQLQDLIQPGQRVRAPFGRGNRQETGFCVSLGPPPSTKHRLKSLAEILDREPLATPEMLQLTRWIAGRYLCTWGQVLHSVIPAAVRKQAGTRMVRFLVPSAEAPQLRQHLKLTSLQQRVMDVLEQAGRPLRIDEVTEAAGCGTGPVSLLRKKGLVDAIQERTATFAEEEQAIATVEDLVLNEDQSRALVSIRDSIESGRHQTILLHGVTGSGKTEVYIRAIREIVSYGRQAIVLVPEISLTPQTIRRFRARFPRVAVLHSHLSDAQRHWHWQQIAQGDVQVVVGARSAVFAPLPRLGLIIIDEEHETTFKQDTTPRYHAREVARRRASMQNIPLILGTATPTLESWLRVEQEHDRLVSLPRRVSSLPLPPVVIVDIRNDPHCSRGGSIGRALENAMRNTLAVQGQVILFLNRRGFSPVLWCKACGESVRCPECDITLTWHRDRLRNICHLCDYETGALTHCPACGHAGIRYLGTGTQRLEEEVRARFGEYRCLRMDSDSMRAPGSHDTALESFSSGQVDILLGTQMIAKGLDFPNVTLVGVVDADTMLSQPDLRASERTFQLIAQVAGRTGRGERGGRVFVQTSSPADPAILRAAEHDFLGFAAAELRHRQEMASPPYRVLTRVIFRGDAESAVREGARAVAEHLRSVAEQQQLSVQVLGPAPAPVARLRGQFRYHLQLAADELEFLQTLWHAAAAGLPAGPGFELAVDVDPVSMR